MEKKDSKLYPFNNLDYNDIITLCGLLGVVGKGYINGMYVDNRAFLSKIGFSSNAKAKEFQKSILGYSHEGRFPVCSTLDDLIKFCNAIEEKYLSTESDININV